MKITELTQKYYAIGVARGWLQVRSASARPRTKFLQIPRGKLVKHFVGGRVRATIPTRVASEHGVRVYPGTIRRIPTKIAKLLITEQKW